jgi:hypothetical protein
MSTEMIDQIGCVKFPRSATPANHLREDTDHFYYVICIRAGSSNTFDGSGRRVSDWQPMVAGAALWEMMPTICKWAASCEGRMMKLYSRDTQPETFIRACRKAVENAITPEQANASRLHVCGQTFSGMKDKDGTRYDLTDLFQLEDWIARRAEGIHTAVRVSALPHLDVFGKARGQMDCMRQGKIEELSAA